MKIQFSDGRTARVGVQIGFETPAVMEEKYGHCLCGKFRSVRLSITMFKDGKEIGQASGVSYCSPSDQFVRSEGRKRALKRLLKEDAGHNLLSKEDRAYLCPIVVRGYKPSLTHLRTNIQNLEATLAKRKSEYEKLVGSDPMMLNMPTKQFLAETKG